MLSVAIPQDPPDESGRGADSVTSVLADLPHILASAR
jgi:hypothetical protein